MHNRSNIVNVMEWVPEIEDDKFVAPVTFLKECIFVVDTNGCGGIDDYLI